MTSFYFITNSIFNFLLSGSCIDGDTRHVGVESFTVNEEFAAAILDSRDLGENELNGWSIAVENAPAIEFILSQVPKIQDGSRKVLGFSK